MRAALRLALAWALCVWLAGSLAAQNALAPVEDAPALLVADQVFITADRKLIAEGNVEAIQGETRLRASRITFDRDSGQLTIDGPIRIDQGGNIIILADAAEMDEELRNGLLTGARMVLNQQIQLAALQMARVNGRYTQLYKSAITSCHVCGDGRPPLWQIRARKIVHDQQERQIYLEGAQLRVLDVPVLYFPGMRLPDPSLKRATGFLVPSIRTTSNLATGIKVPYFIRLGDHRDLTLSPYVSPRTRTLEFRFRQAFRRGRIQFEGAYTRDDLIPGEDRGYVFGAGWFDLPRDYKFRFDIQTTSDNAYLVDYGLPDLDRLRSGVTISRFRRNSAFSFGLTKFKSLRASESNALFPSVVADLRYERRIFPARLGGELRFGFEAHNHRRSSSIDTIGRDVARNTADIEWHRNWILRGGVRAEWRMGFAADVFNIRDDSTFGPNATRTTPYGALTLRYPMTRTARSGAVHFLEPIVQLGWSNVSGDPVPDDESRFVEFDQGNLLSLTRFPAPDRREDGVTLVYGLNWSRSMVRGWQASASIGQVFRKDADPSFTESSGLAGTTSDYLVAGQLKLKSGLALTARSLINAGFSLTKAELRGDWTTDRANLSGTYLWLNADAAEGRANPTSEIWLDGMYEINPSWSAGANLRYDIDGSRATRAAVGVIWQNECVTVDLSLNRRYTSSTSVEPTTDFRFTIALTGFSVEGAKKDYGRSCS